MRSSSFAIIAAFSLLGGCMQVRWSPLYEDAAPYREDDPEFAEARAMESRSLPTPFKHEAGATRLRIESTAARIALFPVNLVLNTVSNVVVGFFSSARGCCFPAPYYGVAGLAYYGPRDAWHGYVFWEPTSSEAFGEWWGIGPVMP